MQYNLIKSDRLGEEYYEATHESGLKVYICPKSEFTSYYALFGTRYGSIDTKFKLEGEQEFTEVPEGIAHFLEHKLFENEDCDAFERFAKTGAYSNAYTSFDRTCYLFSCTKNFEENLDILLDFVRSPYFTEQSVQKEQGIIGQEIRMYDDEPNWRVFFNLCGLLYHNHPVKIDVAGTVESISQITDKLLYKCYNTFYNPSNMFICIAGNVDAKSILDKIDIAFRGAKGVKIERGKYSEPDSIVKDYSVQQMSVYQPLFNIGYKEKTQGDYPLKAQIETEILLEIVAGKSSRLYNSLLEQGLINDSFSAYFFTGFNFACEIFEGESKEPQKVKQAIKQELERLRKEGIDSSDFLRAKNSLYGKDVMLYNSVERIASALVGCAVDRHGLFEVNDVMFSVTTQDINNRLLLNLREENCAMSVIEPIKQ